MSIIFSYDELHPHPNINVSHSFNVKFNKAVEFDINPKELDELLKKFDIAEYTGQSIDKKMKVFCRLNSIESLCNQRVDIDEIYVSNDTIKLNGVIMTVKPSSNINYDIQLPLMLIGYLNWNYATVHDLLIPDDTKAYEALI
jgi:hypothetical protein